MRSKDITKIACRRNNKIECHDTSNRPNIYTIHIYNSVCMYIHVYIIVYMHIYVYMLHPNTKYTLYLAAHGSSKTDHISWGIKQI